MFWLPIVFVCTVDSNCGFIFDKTYSTRAECSKALQKLEKALPQDKFPMFKAACIDVEVTGGKNSI